MARLLVIGWEVRSVEDVVGEYGLKEFAFVYTESGLSNRIRDTNGDSSMSRARDGAVILSLNHLSRRGLNVQE